MYINLMHIIIFDLNTCMSNIQYLYDDLLLPQSPMPQPHYDALHLLLYINQHINILTYQYHPNDLNSYHDFTWHVWPTIHA